jgi:hypothetical protein
MPASDAAKNAASGGIVINSMRMQLLRGCAAGVVEKFQRHLFTSSIRLAVQQPGCWTTEGTVSPTTKCADMVNTHAKEFASPFNSGH